MENARGDVRVTMTTVISEMGHSCAQEGTPE